MIKRLLKRVSAGLPARVIHIDGRPYLVRYYLGRVGRVTFYLHRFVRSDSERHLHNHPWKWGRAIVLSGGYLEEVVTDLAPAAISGEGCVTEYRGVAWYNRVNGNHFHRIASVEPDTWTLFFHGPRQILGARDGMASRLKGWGFLERDLRDGEWVTVFKLYPSAHSDWWVNAPKGRELDL